MVVVAMNGPNQTAAQAPFEKENGRLYHGYRRGIYMYPCDEFEMDRLDMMNHLFGIARQGKLTNVPIPKNLPEGERYEVLDLGAGSGIWAINIAECNKSTYVLGLDLSNTQPQNIPANLRFRIQSYENPWTLGEESKDLIHLSMGCGSVSTNCWPELYQKIFVHLKPGHGMFEQIEIDFEPRCDDFSAPPRSGLRQWYEHVKSATLRAERPIQYNHDTGRMLQQQRFTDIQETIIRIPSSSWPRSENEKELGRWWGTMMVDGRGFEALSLAPLTRMFGWEKSQVETLCLEAAKEIRTERHHFYHNMHIWTARRPA